MRLGSSPSARDTAILTATQDVFIHPPLPPHPTPRASHRFLSGLRGLIATTLSHPTLPCGPIPSSDLNFLFLVDNLHLLIMGSGDPGPLPHLYLPMWGGCVGLILSTLTSPFSCPAHPSLVVLTSSCGPVSFLRLMQRPFLFRAGHPFPPPHARLFSTVRLVLCAPRPPMSASHQTSCPHLPSACHSHLRPIEPGWKRKARSCHPLTTPLKPHSLGSQHRAWVQCLQSSSAADAKLFQHVLLQPNYNSLQLLKLTHFFCFLWVLLHGALLSPRLGFPQLQTAYKRNLISLGLLF